MIPMIFNNNYMLALGMAFAFALTIILMRALADKLPHDQGRAFAVEGALSRGKVRGAGIVFVIVFIVSELLFDVFSVEMLVYLIVIFLCMLSGFLDDASEKPWNEYLKGALDFVLAVAVAVNYLYFNGNSFYIAILQKNITIPYLVYGILIVVLVWVAINVTNCTDGVDGLSATLSIITLGSFYVFMGRNDGSNYFVALFMIVLVAYLWYNATPSTMLMGDAGSRAMGMVIAITALVCKCPLLYIPFSIMMILDGGLGLVKVAVIRFLRIKGFMKNIRCPLHDQARKVNEWSNTQVVFRFAIIQTIISVVYLFLIAA